MIDLQNIYVQNVTPPAAILDNTAVTTGEVDTVVNGVKWNYVTFLVSLGATDIAVSTLKLQQSDTSGSGFADVTGTVGGTDFTLPSSTSDNGVYAIHVDMRGKKRYLDLSLTVGDGAAGTYVSILAIFSRAAEIPVTATGKGLAAEIIV